MPKVSVSREIAGEQKAVFKAVKTYLDGRDTLKKLGAEILWDEKKCTGEIESSSFSGAITVAAGKGKKTDVAINIDLPLLMTPFRGKVEEELKKHLGRVEV